MTELRFEAQAGNLAAVRERVHEALRALGASEDCARDVVLAVDEACQNIIRHAYRRECDEKIVLVIERRGERIELVLTDFAEAVDPSRIKPRALDDVRPGGLGTHLIRSIMDEVEYQPARSGRGNRLRMVKRIE